MNRQLTLDDVPDELLADYWFTQGDNIWALPGVGEITDRLKAAE